MGEVAEMMLDGTLCEGCGVFLNEAAPGYPRTCRECGAERKSEGKSENVAAHQARQAAQKKVPCPTCGRRVKSVGLADHVRDSHSEVEQPPKPSTDPRDQYKPAFEKWAVADGTYHLASGNWRMVSNGGVPGNDHVRPYRQDRTMHTFEGFIAGLEAGRAELASTLRGLDGYMERTGLGDDHPWRREIAAALRGAA